MPHIVLFAWFFLLTAAQFDRVGIRMIAWSFAATFAMDLLVEIEEGATRTGVRRLTDVLPDLLGGLLVTAVLGVAMRIRRQTTPAPQLRP